MMVNGTDGVVPVTPAARAGFVGVDPNTLTQELTAAATKVELLDQASGALTGSTTEAQDTSLAIVAELLGTDGETLLHELQDGGDLPKMLELAGLPPTALSGLLERGMLLDDSV